MRATAPDTQTQVQSVMNRHPVTIREDETIRDAVEKMTETHVSALPVIDESLHLKGILTLSDLLRVIQDAEQTLDRDEAVFDDNTFIIDLIRECLANDEVASVMSGPTVTAQQGQPLQDVAKSMMIHQIHHVPVVNKEHRLLGIVSATDFVRLAAEGN